MKICPECGNTNSDNSKFCRNCGCNLENVAIANVGINQNSTAQTPNQAPAQKNKWIASILNLIGGLILYCLCGIGQIVYLRLYGRGLILCAVGLFLSIISGIIIIFNESLLIDVLSFVIGMALVIYSAYDAYLCSQAINEGKKPPMLFGIIDSESLTKTHMIAIVIICIVGLLALGSAIVLSPDDDMSQQFISDDSLSGSSDLQIKITCPTEWSASIGDEDSSTHYEGTGNKIIYYDSHDYDVIAAVVQKTKSGSDNLKVEIIKNGKTLDMESTNKDFGVATVSATLK